MNPNASAFSIPDGARNARSDGLTKRELLAAMMMQGLLSSYRRFPEADRAAVHAVTAADALIAELSK